MSTKPSTGQIRGAEPLHRSRRVGRPPGPRHAVRLLGARPVEEGYRRRMAAGKALRGRLGNAAGAFTSNARNPNLRRAQLSFFGAWTAEWAFTVGLGIVAYRDGGATAVGLVGLLRMVPSAMLTPLLSPLADKGRRERVLILVSVLRGVGTGEYRNYCQGLF